MVGYQNQKSMHKVRVPAAFSRILKKQGDMHTREILKDNSSFPITPQLIAIAMLGSLRHFAALNSCSLKGHKEEIKSITG